jgi:hypothetical protein
MTYHALLTDFDGTIYHFERGVAPGVTAALQTLVGRGLPFGICTGRQFAYIQPYILEHGLGGAHITCCGSQLVAADGHILRQSLIPHQMMRDIHQQVEALGGALILKQNHRSYANPAALNANGGWTKHVPNYPLSDIEDWSCASFYVRLEEADHWASFEATCPATLFKQRSRMGGYFADGVAPGVSKGGGVAWWCEHHGLDPQAVVGVGDGENDLPFLSAVGLKLVMGNAVPELKPLADHVIPSLQEEGVRWAVEQFFGESNQ